VLSVKPPKISWLPGWVNDARVEGLRVASEQQDFDLVRPRLDYWECVGQTLRQRSRSLKQLKVDEIVEGISTAAGRWLDPQYSRRVLTEKYIASATGMSLPTVASSLEAEFRNYTADSIWRALRREFGDPRVLDGLTYDGPLSGKSVAIGADLVCQVFTGNVPGLPALGIVRCLLAKSAIVAKVASGEPTFAAQFAATLSEVQPRFGDAILITYWDREDDLTRSAVLSQVDVVVAYGGDEVCGAIQGAILPGQRLYLHGDKMSVGLLSRKYLRTSNYVQIAADVARDASMFDQHACIAAQAYLIEGDMAEVQSFAIRVADAMRTYAQTFFPASLQPVKAAALQLRRASAQYRVAQSQADAFWAGDGWTVTLSDRLSGQSGPGDRFLTLVAVPSLSEAIAMLRPLGSRLQNIGLGAEDDEMNCLASALAQIGAARICAPGRMSDPSLAWRHDGRMCIAELVRWCDVEMHPWTAEDHHRRN
jgi:Acyl-CoA reductase (LuxC)